MDRPWFKIDKKDPLTIPIRERMAYRQAESVFEAIANNPETRKEYEKAARELVLWGSVTWKDGKVVEHRPLTPAEEK